MKAVKNGAFWYDIQGNQIEAHGGWILEHHGFYYWYGEDRSGDHYVNCYRSQDLVTWEFRRTVLSTQSPTSMGRVKADLRLKNEAGGKVNIERPKVIYNRITEKYVMWMHYENGTDYKEAACAVAICDSPDGDFIYLGHFNPYGEMSRDCTLFQDEDGTGYFISTARDNADIHIYRLQDDYLNVDILVTSLWPGEYREAPAVFKRNGIYYMLTSYCTGWAPNQGMYATASSIDGRWSTLRPFGDDTTFHSQPAFVLPLECGGEQRYLYAGDRWDGENYRNSKYLFWFLTFDEKGQLYLEETDETAMDEVRTNSFRCPLPDILTSISGMKIDSVKKWECFRRPEIVSLFEQNIYGQCKYLERRILRAETTYGGCWKESYRKEEIRLSTPGGDIFFNLYLPFDAESHFRVFIYLRLTGQEEEAIPIKYILDRGYAVAQISTENIAKDSADGWQQGVYRAVILPGDMSGSGLLGIWSYALSWVMDYIETDSRLDETRCIVTGFSRGGKCVLWTAARDQRFKLCAALHSGCTGAGISRWGKENRETVAEITDKFPYWFCRRYREYAEKIEYMPVDQHMLLALIAPRPLFLAGALEDPFANPWSEIESARNASQIYHLYGEDGLYLLSDSDETGPGKGGKIAYYIKGGGHVLTELHWKHLLDFSDSQL